MTARVRRVGLGLVALVLLACGARDARTSSEAAGVGSSSADVSSAAANSSLLPASASAALPGASSSPAPSTTASASAPAVPSSPRLTLPATGPYRALDLHVDTPWRVHFKGRPRALPDGPVTPSLLRSGGYAGLVYPIYLPDYLHDDHPTIADADAIFDTIESVVAEQEPLVFEHELPPSGELPDGQVVVFVSIEGAGAFADDVTQIERFVRRGVRFVGPVHARDNRLGGAATGKTRGGLTALGRDFCERVYAAGALVDVSHLSDAGIADLEPIARRHGAPIVATHSNARARHDHPRNLTDEQLRVIADTGGVAGLNLHRGFLPGQKLSSIVAMVKHMVKVAGTEHVALGTDFDGGTPPKELADASRMPALAEALREAGFDDADVRKIFATNALRVLAWRPKPRSAAK